MHYILVMTQIKLILRSLLVFTLLLTLGRASAHEGMWIPSLLNSLNADHLEASGLRLSPDDLYSINNGSLKDAIVHFGGGCTAEVISDQGLILTNYHCGYGQVQSHSSVERDYLQDGFWAEDMASELSNPGLTATFISRIEDVTDRVLIGVTENMDENERNKLIYENSAKVEAGVEEGLKGSVRAFFYGNEFYLIVTKTYNDVRLVGAPPSSIGKYGGDTDNWIWPRHTGDFALFRIYADSNNEPAEYSEANQPYSPSRHLKISMSGADEGDFVMVYGFPGRTQQYLTSDAVDQVISQSNPMRIEMRETSLAVIDKAMLEDDEVRIKYAAKQARISNAYKKWIGQNFGLKRFKALEKKKAYEKEFKAWLREEPEMSKKYGSLLENLSNAQEEVFPYQKGRELFIEYVYYGPEIVRFSNRFYNLVNNYSTLKAENGLDAEIDKLKKQIEGHFKNYDESVDIAVFNALTPLYMSNLDASLRPDFFKTTYKTKYHSEADKLSAKMYGSSIFTDKVKLLAMLDNFSEKSIKLLKKDLAYIMMDDLFETYFNEVRPNLATRMNRIDELMRDYVVAQQAMSPGDMFFPDANSTLRLTYGKVEGSKPRDGVEYLHHTTFKGVIDKYQAGHRDFDLPQGLLDLYESGDYGQYADKDGTLHVCFTGSNHTSGGNSGSPALDADGNLIGLNFDRTWESTMSDIAFSPELCRNIMVDIRYVLFIIDKYAGADHIIDELELVNAGQ